MAGASISFYWVALYINYSLGRGRKYVDIWAKSNRNNGKKRVNVCGNGYETGKGIKRW